VPRELVAGELVAGELVAAEPGSAELASGDDSAGDRDHVLHRATQLNADRVGRVPRR